jgi:hypothetical protein
MNSAQNGGHDSSGGTQQPDLDCQLDSEQMNLVQVLSHQEEQPELKNALSFKSECVCQLVDICEQIRPGFLKTSAFQTSDRQQVYLDDEVLFVKSIDSKAISSWEDFEFILSVVVENRILKVFVAHQVKLSLEQPIDVCKSDDEETSKKALRKKKSKNKKKRKVPPKDLQKVQMAALSLTEDGARWDTRTPARTITTSPRKNQTQTTSLLSRWRRARRSLKSCSVRSSSKKINFCSTSAARGEPPPTRTVVLIRNSSSSNSLL